MSIDIANLVVNIGNANAKSLVDIFSAWLTPVIGMSMVIIALQQWQTNERKRRHDLFEFRYEKLFREPYQVLRLITEPDWAELIGKTDNMLKELKKYSFLVPNNVYNQLELIYNKAKKSVADYLTTKITKEDYLKQLEQIEQEYLEVLNKHLQIEETPKNLWQILRDLIVKLYYFFAFDKVVYNLELLFKKVQIFFVERKILNLKKEINKT